jgi:hypothetical protein
MQRRSNRGKVVDMDVLALQNEEAIALGNMGVNARGDKIKGGKVVSSKKQEATAYYQNNPKAVSRTMSIKDPVTASVQEHPGQKTVLKKSPAKAKVKKTVEVELPNGDIEIRETEE